MVVASRQNSVVVEDLRCIGDHNTLFCGIPELIFNCMTAFPFDPKGSLQ